MNIKHVKQIKKIKQIRRKKRLKGVTLMLTIVGALTLAGCAATNLKAP